MTELPPCRQRSGRLKTTYRSAAKARQAIKASSRHIVRAYRCLTCGYWHVTSNPARTPVPLIGGHVLYIDKRADQVEQDSSTALAGEYTHIRWNGHRKPGCDSPGSRASSGTRHERHHRKLKTNDPRRTCGAFGSPRTRSFAWPRMRVERQSELAPREEHDEPYD